MEHTRRTFFATLFAPLLTKLLPGPKAGDRVFSDELLAKAYQPWGPSQVHLIMKSRQVGMTSMSYEIMREQMERSIPVMHSLLVSESNAGSGGNWFRKAWMERNRV